jgi:glutamyl-tRNA reductase
MNSYLIGIDYAKAHRKIIDSVYAERKNIAAFWSGISGIQSVLLLTCNRLEVYIAATDAPKARNHINLFLRRFPQFCSHGYIRLDDREVFRHALSLASGLESQLKGEQQILEQLESWIAKEYFPGMLKSFWGKAIFFARDIRATSGLNNPDYNIARLVANDFAKFKVTTNKLKVIIIGTGKIARLFALLRDIRIEILFVAHKNILTAKKLADYSGGRQISFKELKDEIFDAQVLVSATSSPHLVLRKGDLPPEIFNRKDPLYIYDLAFPFDIDPEVGRLINVVLNNLENLGELFEKHNRIIRHQLDHAQFLVEETVAQYEGIIYESNLKSGDTPQPFSLKTG